MNKLKEQFDAVRREYVRQVAEVFDGFSGDHVWRSSEQLHNSEGPFIFSYDGVLISLRFGELEDIVNNIDEWLKRYGTRQDIGREVKRWYEWCAGNRLPSGVPIISLYDWLTGNLQDWTKLKRLRSEVWQKEHDIKVLERLMRDNRDNRTLCNVRDSLKAEIKEMRKQYEQLSQE